MNEYIDTLKDTSLFSGIEPQEIDGLLKCLSTRHVQYAKGGYIIEEGDKVYDFGIILSGHGRAIKWDSSGRLIIISLLKAGSEIGVILAASLDHKSPAAVQAQEDVLVLQRSRLNGFWPGAKGDVPGMTGCCATI